MTVIYYSIFKIKPECGLLSGTYQLFVLEMSPKKSQLYQHILDCIINNCPDFKQVPSTKHKLLLHNTLGSTIVRNS